jgi:hypothetical protein
MIVLRLLLACSSLGLQQTIDQHELLDKLTIVVAQLDEQSGSSSGSKPARYSQMGVEYAEQGQFFQAMACLSVAVKVDPSRTRTYTDFDSVEEKMVSSDWSTENDDMFQVFVRIVDGARGDLFDKLYTDGMKKLSSHAWREAGKELCRAG